MLLVQANGGLGMVLVLVKQTKELPVIFPVPAGVVHVHEAFVLDLARDLVEGRKNIRGGRTLRPKLFFLRQAERADARENFQPRQEEPADRGDGAERPAAGDEINGKKRGDENPERSDLLRKRGLETAQGDAERRHAEREKKAKEHYGLIWCSFRNFSS